MLSEPIFLINLKKKVIKKHLSVISFKPDAPVKFPIKNLP